MGPMALVVLGLFVLVWIISAVVKASQSAGPANRQAASRPRPIADSPRVERTSDTDIDRFMAEIDRLRRRGEPAPTGRSPQGPRPIIERGAAGRSEARPRPGERRDRERERRPRQQGRPTLTPPPLPVESVPVLRPVEPIRPSIPSSPPPPPATPAKPARPAKLATVAKAPPSPVLLMIQGVLKSKHGPAAAVILAEILGEPPGRRGTVRPPHHPKHG
jgi:hypothetical protein